MEIEKFTDSQVRSILSHTNRTYANDANTDIDPGKTNLNYSLTPYIDVSREDYQSDGKLRSSVRKAEYDYYRRRKEELYCYNRADVCTLAGCVVTLPEELVGHPDKAERFFDAVTKYLCERYGGDPTEDGRLYPNVVSVTVHYDEKQLDGSAGLRGHLHFNFIPAVKIDHEKLMAKKNHVKMMEFFDYKISAKELINKKDLSTLHQDLAAYLEANGVEGRVLMKSESEGRTINIPVAQLKEYTERTGRTVDREVLKELTVDKVVAALEQQRDREKEHTWGHDSVWGKHRREDLEWTR